MGTGADSITVTLGFMPSYLMIIPIYTASAASYDAAFLRGNAATQLYTLRGGSTQAKSDMLSFSSSGFTVLDTYNLGFNKSGMTYQYIAFR